MRSDTRRALIAGTAVLGSAIAVACALFVLGLPPDSRRSLESVVPGLFELETLAVVALLPTVAVSAVVALAVCLEATRQFSAAHQRRRELEGQALERTE